MNTASLAASRTTLLLVFIVGLLLAGCHTPDWTKNQPDQCEVHAVTMTRRAVPIAYGMIPMSKVEGERGPWRQRTEYYPHPGDCLPATSITAHGESRAIVFVCRKCEATKLEFEAGVGQCFDSAGPPAAFAGKSPSPSLRLKSSRTRP